MGALREATPQDAGFLREMLIQAVVWRGAVSPHSAEAIAAPHMAVYLDGWGRPGDAGLIAEDEQPVGATWYRVFTEGEHGYGFIETGIPELTLAVAEQARGRGIGTSLLRALAGRAHAEGHYALSLSVEEDNPARRLYERVGFVRVGRVGNAWTMRIDLGSASQFPLSRRQRARRRRPRTELEAGATPVAKCPPAFRSPGDPVVRHSRKW
jgi:ribosomal protein S18 acetylase RimI-like enzyme